MSGHKYINNTGNLFDDVDNENVVNNCRSRIPVSTQSRAGPAHRGHLGKSDQVPQLQDLLDRQRESEQRTLDSSARIVGLLRDSEQTGLAAAEELVRQREKLDITNERLDKINNDLTVTQKHLNGIKSVFSGLKNYISGKSDLTPPRSQTSIESIKSGPSKELGTRISSNLTPDHRFAAHPSTRLRGLDEQVSASITGSQRVNQKLDDNLVEMVDAIERLKTLGMDLGQEIEAQNELIDKIQDKVEEADLRIAEQNKQMNKLLG